MFDCFYVIFIRNAWFHIIIAETGRNDAQTNFKWCAIFKKKKHENVETRSWINFSTTNMVQILMFFFSTLLLWCEHFFKSFKTLNLFHLEMICTFMRICFAWTVRCVRLLIYISNEHGYFFLGIHLHIFLFLAERRSLLVGPTCYIFCVFITITFVSKTEQISCHQHKYFKTEAR